MLGITEEELRDELREGKTIVGLAERQGVELGTVSEALQQAREEALVQGVEQGRITQEQADRARLYTQRRTQSCLIRSGLGACTGLAPRRADLSSQPVTPVGSRLRGMANRRQ